jgi:o-succinylbenzoate synthase
VRHPHHNDDPVIIDEIELRVVRVPFRAPVRTSYATLRERAAILVTVRSDGVEGYGEGVMEEVPLYLPETTVGAFSLLRDVLTPSLLASPDVVAEDVYDSWAALRGNSMAKAALELAVWDCHARQLGVPMRELLGGVRASIPVGASLGLASIDDTLANIGRHVDEGYLRIKLKIEPGADIEVVAAVRGAFGDIDLSVDANCAYSLADADTLRTLDGFALSYLEQPLHWDDLVDHAALARTMTTPLCLDESLTSPERATAALALGACSVVNAKVARFGGLTALRRVHDRCVDDRVAMWCGGMYETGIGRAHNIHLATMPGFVLPGDTASASRTYTNDVVNEPLEATDGMMPVPKGPGIGVTLAHEYIADITEHVETLTR